MNNRPFYETVWEKQFLNEGELITNANSNSHVTGTVYYDSSSRLEDPYFTVDALQSFRDKVNKLSPKVGDGFDYISIGQLITLLNSTFGESGYRFIEVSRRIDSICGYDYHFIIRMALIIPSYSILIIREGLESISNKALKPGHRGYCIGDSDLSHLLDTSPEGALSLWKNAEADAKKRCAVDLGVGAQFLPDPAENSKNGRKINKPQKAEKEPSGEEVQTEDELVKRSVAMADLKAILKTKGMKSPDLYPIASAVLKRDISKWDELSSNDMNTIVSYFNGGEVVVGVKETTV